MEVSSRGLCQPERRIKTKRIFGSIHPFYQVDIVLPKDMVLREAHDIGETLQKKIERLENVERAFVHLDYEFAHHPTSEHKVV
ncbi:unnamed protein product [Protopolystoma xenopodis]|uniref:Cation efflux protein cytoplasmic domain-containing protein n=1 Tax=Protopolystoma xenopodis TaxID=117903 RepID=A0A3S5CB00_9PLAT|nr:unnamed protein product [Protopolystoma xenopodis]